MMKPFTVLRATLATGLLEPVVCSANGQIAVNNSDHITILEPRLPLVHQCLTTSSKSETVVDSLRLYDVHTVFNVENLELFGFQIFSRLLIEDGEQQFNFGRIAEPLIVAHKWSPLNESDKDCLLGVLLNTGEVFVLKRLGIEGSKYDPVFRSFTVLLDEMQLALERLTAEGDVILLNAQYLELKVTDFSFGETAEGTVLVLSHESGNTTIHRLGAQTQTIARFSTGTVVKLCWAQGRLITVGSDNSVNLFDTNELVIKKAEVKAKSRFLVSNLKVQGDVLIIADTRSLWFFDISNNCAIASVKTVHTSVVTSVELVEATGHIQVYAFHETGQVTSCRLKKCQTSAIVADLPPAWGTFLKKILYKFQLANALDRNKSEMFSQFSSECEGGLLNFGTRLAPNGTLVTVYTVSACNVVQHQIRSRMEFNVGFLAFSSICDELRPAGGGTSLNYLNTLVLNNLDSVKVDAESILKWKLSLFKPANEIAVSFAPGPNLDENLQMFRLDAGIAELQRLKAFNVGLKKTMLALASADTLVLGIDAEQDAIHAIIMSHLARAIVPAPASTPLDKFLLLSFYHLLPEEDKAAAAVPDKAAVTIDTDLCTESFFITKDVVPASFSKSIQSTEGHSWQRCASTLVPIMTLDNECDELQLFSYVDGTGLDSTIVAAIQRHLRFCIHTGTRRLTCQTL